MLVLSDTFFPISGYRITEQIYCGGKTLVYRGVREQDQKSVVIKVMRNEYPSFNEIAQFRNQYTITKNLEIEGIIKPLSLENYRNGYALVMEDFGGISLQDWVQQNKGTEEYSLTLREFFPIAIAIVSILEKLHCDRIIHKDIKPANILINPSTLEVKLIDFSIATLLPREIQQFTNPNVLEGTLAYISPEQTGRMNRGIDYRSDFYSLGVTFFELLSGHLPFTSHDPMELVYCHIAKQPPLLENSEDIPQVVADIVMKLMAKNAEDRYQNAYGLKYDLEICCKQWQETGKIAPFELRTKDISDRFLIPEKLYGRQQEVATLLATFERVVRGATEIMLVAGFSGIGKTAVVNEIHKPIIRQQSYFIKGKFDQFQRDIPLSALVQAFRDLIGQILLENDVQIQQWRTKILSALGEQAQVIIDVIPELERIIGKQPKVAELSGVAIQNRFNLLFQRFLKIFNAKSHPLVIFLDDLQWADTASLKFIQFLMSQTNAVQENSYQLNHEIAENVWTPIFDGKPWTVEETENSDKTKGGLLLIGAYRSNEVTQTHPLCLTLQEIAKTGTIINHIDIAPLNQSNLNLLIADTLGCQEEIAVPLSQMVFAKTKGNPFFTTQFLNFLYHEGIIKINFDLGYWQYNLDKIKELALTDDVVEFMALQIEKLPRMTQNVLKLAACIGNEFDLKTLAIVHEKSVVDTASDIWKALHEGIILPQTELYKLFQDSNELSDVSIGQVATKAPGRNLQPPKYKFIHDRVQQAAYSLIPEDKRKEIHLKIGQLLLSNIPVAERKENIFQLVNQLNMAVELITDQIKCDELAEMNLVAGLKALASTAYAAAFKYLKTGIELLSDTSWKTKYELTLALHETAAEAAYLAGDFDQMEQLVQVVLLQATTLLEKVKVYEIKIQAYTSKNRLLEAIAIAREALNHFGVYFPKQPNESDIQQKLAETAVLLAGKTIDDLTNLPLMTSANEMAIVRIASSMIPPTFIADTWLFPLVILSQINLSIHYGNSPLSAFSYACYGILLSDINQDIIASNEIGKLALALVERFGNKDIKTRTYFVIGAFIFHQKSHIRETLPLLLEGYKSGLETGNVEFVGYCAMKICQHSYFIGKVITEIEKEINSYSCVLENFQQITTLNYCQIFLQSILNLLGKGEKICITSGEAYNEEQSLKHLIEANDIQGIHYLYLNKLILSYLFGNFQEAQDNAIKSREYLAGGTGFITVPIFYFYDSLTALVIYLETQPDQDNLLRQVADNQVKLCNWAHHAPMNYLHKYYLVEAERYRVVGKYIEAIDYYERSIKLAKEHKFIHEEALANELAAKFYLEWGKPKIAQSYLTDAYYCYSRWGAKTKVDDLVKHYPQLLAPIFQKEKLLLHQFEQITSPSYQSLSSLNIQQTVIGSQTSISHSLDLASIIKASQALSGEIELEKLLTTLMQVVMENAGASKSALILNDSDNFNLTVTAVSTSSTSIPILTELSSILVEHSSDIPITLINYVKRTKEIFVTDNANTVVLLASDRYIIHKQPQSLLCIPIINQGKLLGILYLENHLTTGAFTSDRIQILKLLTTQAAISLENAILYESLATANQHLEEQNHTLEKKVAERTQELQQKNQALQQTLQELQRTQTQLIQSEKMSSLGQMVAGIAHEINNPINFIHGNIDHASKYVQDLLDLIAAYQHEYPHPSNLVKQKASEIDVNFLSQDFLDILASMKAGSSRISNIILGLRNFSRLDESEIKPVDIHEGIENTLMILQHRLTKKSHRPEIQVIREYSQIPLVNCYASQLNQVFMNILNNAIDALEESIVQNSGKLTRPTIHIRTQLSNSNTLQMRIADNGLGMTAAVQQKIFDPFFTTKPVGSGTGLGLSISYQVIVEKHKGNLTCISTLGEGTEFIIEFPI
ncbi:trifunctional serine/threonine-protein kinase/ATP-binding protein/sensor histidine kinase [Nostoc sp. UHCC 0870]|uniref:trifunctional serine/threonine-protein kinase/ATP-binding protein/sensor histidine kinase n=1 Tax=Nostoc sp. UHCC 0870 TaxID=2914041 RepID=UPI001EE105E4|nr:ATP-binding sensor histidine kinase [Nostoc sp. UHCC 0870]UKO97663.1 AAA family ATPase [Nostoc sp. UHCC 0870]